MAQQAQGCFESSTLQTIHKWGDTLLLCFIAALGWWLVEFNTRVTKEAEARQILSLQVAAINANHTAIMDALNDLKHVTALLEARLYQLTIE